MNNTTARLDAILASSTAIGSFADLLATDAHYVPTLDLREAPALYEVAAALVAAGRDAYLRTKNGAGVFASALAFKAPEALAAEFGIVVPAPPARRLRGLVFTAYGETWKAERVGHRWFGAHKEQGVVARRWNRSRGAFNPSARFVAITEAAAFLARADLP